MGAAESNPVRNLDKRTARRTYRDAFRGAVKRYRTSARVAEQWAYLGEEGEKEWDEGALKVCVRKRPIFKPEIQGKEFDVLTVTHNKLITVHDARMHADMRRQLMNHHEFIFDRVFTAKANNDEVYLDTAAPLVKVALEGGFATCLMYGQTGSGKTYTMTSIYERAAFELFDSLKEGQTVSVSFVEIAGDKCNDLFNGFKSTQLLTGKDESVHAFPVVEPVVANADDLLAMINHGCGIRTTEATGVHDASSRSHAILRIYIQSGGGGGGGFPGNREEEGVLTLVDLAGSEHRIDSMYHTAKLRKEGGQINASLMALKQCVHAKAAGKNASHIYRKSKLTMALKMSFILPSAKTVVIATVSPSSKDTEHSLNTLRHACVMDGQSKKETNKESKSSHIEGGNVRTVRVGVVQVSKEARKMKVMNAREKDKLLSNGNTFGHGAAHTEWAKAPTEKEIEKQHRLSERAAFKRLATKHKELLKKFRGRLGRDPRQEKRLQTYPQENIAWWGNKEENNNNNVSSVDQQWVEADIHQLLENDSHRQGRMGFKNNRNSNNKKKLPLAPPHVYRKLKSIIFNDVSLHINVKKRQLKKLLKKKGYSSDVPELRRDYVADVDDDNTYDDDYNNVQTQNDIVEEHIYSNNNDSNMKINSRSFNVQNISLPSSQNNYNAGEAFIPSEDFTGLKDGYAFKNGHLGVGYYLEGSSNNNNNNNNGSSNNTGIDNVNVVEEDLPYGGDINEAMRLQDRDAVRKIMATRSDYRSDSRNSDVSSGNKENGTASHTATRQQASLFKQVNKKPAKSRHQLARERRQKQIEKEQAALRKKQSSSRSGGGGSLHDEIEALEIEIANATTAASKVGLKKRLAQKKAVLIRQERKAGQARREAERAAEAERRRKKQLEKLQLESDDGNNMMNNEQVSPLSRAVANHDSMMQQQQYNLPPQKYQQGYAPQQFQQQLQPPPQYQYNQEQQQQYQYGKQQDYGQQQQQQYGGSCNQQYNQPQPYSQQQQQEYAQSPYYQQQQGGNNNNNNFQREVDADNWSPGDWRKMSASYNNQNQKGGVSSAPFANDYTWDKERY